MNVYQCNWHRSVKTPCEARATQIILYGCLNQHTDETVLCYPHAVDWLDQYQSDNGYLCQTCSERLEAYQVVRMLWMRKDPKFRLRNATLLK
jgi:hypothetical protein